MKIIKKLFLVALSAGLLSVPSQLEKVEAYTVNANTYIYYEKPSSWGADYVQLLIGHDSWSEGYSMTNITGTDIYYVRMIKWDGYTQYGFMNTNEAKWGGEGSAPKDRIPWAVNKTQICYASGLQLNKTYNIFGGSDTDPWGLPTQGASYSSLNFKISTDSTVGGTASIKGNELTSATAVTQKSGTSVNILKFTDATLTATPSEGYEFEGWFDSTTATEALSTSSTYTVTNITEAKTYYARFKEDETAKNAVKDLFSKYYGDGTYTKKTTINLKENVETDLASNFHAGITKLERTTYYKGTALWMENDNGYSYYGTSEDNMTSGKVSSLEQTSSSIAVKGKTMEEYYCTLHDFVEGTHNSIHSNNKDLDLTAGWKKEGNVYVSTNEDVLDAFRLFTAPLWIGKNATNENYLTYTKATVEELDETLIMRLYVSTTEYSEKENEGKITDSTGVFSQAVITK